jgi:hypothetical protein
MNFLDCKKMPPLAAPAPQEPRWGEHHRVDPGGDEQLGEVNVIRRGSKKLEREISLA